MSDEEVARAYRATTWTVWLPSGTVELRLGDAIGEPLLRCAGIVTAFNPASALQPLAENRRANRALEQHLHLHDLEFFPTEASGTGPDADLWVEPGFAVRTDEPGVVVALGVRFAQNAIVWIDAAGTPSLIVTRAGFCGLQPGDTLPISG
jgi:hypothetical protein